MNPKFEVPAETWKSEPFYKGKIKTMKVSFSSWKSMLQMYPQSDSYNGYMY